MIVRRRTPCERDREVNRQDAKDAKNDQVHSRGRLCHICKVGGRGTEDARNAEKSGTLRAGP